MSWTTSLPRLSLEYILRFMADGKTGQIVLEIKDGLIIKGHVTEHWQEHGLTEVQK